MSLGMDFWSRVYAESLALALTEAGLTVQREFPLTVRFRNRVVGEFRADLVVGG
ncbi:MAG: GxxExxY protein, partial [Gemmatimonadales bacterium]